MRTGCRAIKLFRKTETLREAQTGPRDHQSSSGVAAAASRCRVSSSVSSRSRQPRRFLKEELRLLFDSRKSQVCITEDKPLSRESPLYR